jgi:CDP-glucose 4,6-dehydratase
MNTPNTSFSKLFNGIYQGKKVLITGNTGFKGSWLALWLHKMGAEVLGYALAPDTTPSHWELLNLNVKTITGDIRNSELLNKTVQEFQPEIIFHLAAQPLVRASYEDPVGTYETNVIGTLNVYQAARACSSVRAIVSITTDKVYQNNEWEWGYREIDALGGYDPYSASKACAEILSSSYRNSFLNPGDYGKEHKILLSTTRAGNVIGGGDWAKDRLIPDLVRAAMDNKETLIRYPYATRPWEHVLEPLSGYLLIGMHLLEENMSFAEAWNFGPDQSGMLTVEGVISRMAKNWPRISYRVENRNEYHEAGLLKLDCSKAHSKLKWFPLWDGNDCFAKTANWYQSYYEDNKVISEQQLEEYITDGLSRQVIWTQ